MLHLAHISLHVFLRWYIYMFYKPSDLASGKLVPDLSLDWIWEYPWDLCQYSFWSKNSCLFPGDFHMFIPKSRWRTRNYLCVICLMRFKPGTSCVRLIGNCINLTKEAALLFGYSGLQHYRSQNTVKVLPAVEPSTLRLWPSNVTNWAKETLITPVYSRKSIPGSLFQLLAWSISTRRKDPKSCQEVTFSVSVLQNAATDDT